MKITVTEGHARAIPTKAGNTIHVQRAYYHNGDEYPDKIEMVHGDPSEVLPPGDYSLTAACFGNDRNGRFGMVWGWPSKLQKVSDKPATKAA